MLNASIASALMKTRIMINWYQGKAMAYGGKIEGKR